MSHLLFFSQVLLLWCLCTAGAASHSRHAPPGRRTGAPRAYGPLARAAVAAGGVLLATWSFTTAGILLAVLAAAGTWALVAGRPRASRDGLLAVLEAGSLVVFSGVSWGLIQWGDLATGFPLLPVPVTEERLAFVYLAASGFVLALWQSGNIVYGVLSGSRLLPGTAAAGPSESGAREHARDIAPEGEPARQLSTGRLIGYLERFLLVLLVIKGSYAGLGFLVAAKGLIRAREFEQKHLAEYFLVGTFLSVACALVIGIAIQIAYTHLW